jgi:hypothetical protein
MHPIHRVTGFRNVGEYTLSVDFADGSTQTICFEPMLYGRMFGPLRERFVFDQVRLDEEIGTLVWPNGADFDPATLHDWPTHRDELERRARDWASTASRTK